MPNLMRNLRQLLIYLFLAAGFLTASTWLLPNPYLAGGWNEFRSSLVPALTKLGDWPVVNWLILVLFWGTLGLGCYWLIIQLANLVIGIRNQYQLERKYVNRGKVRPLWLKRLGAWLAVVTAAGLSWAWLLPFYLKAFGEGLAPARILAVIGLALNFWLLARLVGLARQGS